MIAYASNTGTKRNLAALREAGWRILLTPDNPTPREGFRHAIDNGAWKAFQRRQPFDGPAFLRLVEKHGPAADFVVIPDVVAGGMESLAFSLEWMRTGLKHLTNLLLPVQDGMDVRVVGGVLRRYPFLGIFLGGSTEWKLKEMYAWGMVAHAMNRYYHVGRVNTARRIRLCAEAGVDSFDGTSATKYSCTLPLLDNARKQPSLLTPLGMSNPSSDRGAYRVGLPDRARIQNEEEMPKPETPASIEAQEVDYKENAWQQYTLQELGNWVHLLAKRATHRSNHIKRTKDLQDAQAYLDMMQSNLDALKTAP